MLHPALIPQFHALFNFVDRERRGVISKAQLHAVTKLIGMDTDIDDLFDHLDTDNSGSISFFEFMDMLQHGTRPMASRSRIRKAFEVFENPRKKGECATEHIKTVLGALVSSVEERMLDETYIDLVDPKSSGSIHFAQIIDGFFNALGYDSDGDAASEHSPHNAEHHVTPHAPHHHSEVPRSPKHTKRGSLSGASLVDEKHDDRQGHKKSESPKESS